MNTAAELSFERGQTRETTSGIARFHLYEMSERSCENQKWILGCWTWRRREAHLLTMHMHEGPFLGDKKKKCSNTNIR